MGILSGARAEGGPACGGPDGVLRSDGRRGHSVAEREMWPGSCARAASRLQKPGVSGNLISDGDFQGDLAEENFGDSRLSPTGPGSGVHANQTVFLE